MCKSHLNCSRLFYISTGFLLLFTAYLSAQGLTTKVMKDNNFGNLGFYSLGILYCTFGISSFFAAPLVNKMGERCALGCGSLCYVFYLGAFIPPLLRSEYKENQTL